MSILFLAAPAALLYLLTAALIWRGPAAGWREQVLPGFAVLLHGLAIGLQVFHDGRVTLGVSEAASLFAWQAALLLWGLSWREPLRSLGLLIYPLAALLAMLAWALPGSAAAGLMADWKTRLHILLSLLSAGLLTLAAVQAVALALQDRWLHQQSQAPLVRGLPPLLTMERLLFQLILIGFCLLSATLLTGLWFLQDWFQQHLAHKIVLSILAWLIFGVLLWGRHRYGWRGKKALRWALSGYGMLILAYFGSKLILEEILGRHWT